jgi:hypothetical protein
VWAKRNIQNKSRETFEKTVELDVSKMPSNAGFRLKPAVGGIRGSPMESLRTTLIVTIRTGKEISFRFWLSEDKAGKEAKRRPTSW